LVRTRRKWGRLFEALVENTAIGICARDPSGEVLIFNPECERLTGWPAAAVRRASVGGGTGGAAAMSPVLDPAAEAMLRPPERLLGGGPGGANQTVQVHLPVGPDAAAKRWLEITWVPVGGPGERPELVVGFLRDIDEQKQLQAHMARIEKLAALGELTAGIAHEVRNPLAAMKLGLNALAESLPDALPEAGLAETGCAALEIIHEIAAEVARLDRVVGRLLDFARVKESEMQEADLAAVVDRTLGYVRNQAKGRRINLNVIAGEGLRPVRCDPDQIQQVLLNIILNAFHAMPAGGELVITLDRLDAVRLPAGETGPAVRIRISDNGCGIPPAVLQKVFDPFFSTRPGGTGLGLSVSFQLVTRHGGDIDIESEVGRGTTVKIILPETGPAAVRSRSPSATGIGEAE
jgi:two-component system sensor histidine kinase AtoS